MSTVEMSETAVCEVCGSQKTANNVCLNVNCEAAASQATRQAVGDTRKAASPAAFTASGRVD